MVAAVNYASYLLRVWHEPPPEGAVDGRTWTIEVESIQSGDSWRFADIASLVGFLEDALSALEERPEP